MSDSSSPTDQVGEIDPNLLVFDEEELRRLTSMDVEEVDEPAPEAPPEPESVDSRSLAEFVGEVENPPPPPPPPLPPRDPIPKGPIAAPAPAPPPPRRGNKSERGERRGVSRRAGSRIAVVAGLMVILAAVSILAQRGDLHRWTYAAADKLDEILSDDPRDLGEVADDGTETAKASKPAPEVDEPDPLEVVPAPLFPEGDEREGEIKVDALPNVEFEPTGPVAHGEVDLRTPTGKAVEIEVEGRGLVVLQPGDVLIELKNGNFIQGRLLKITDRIMRLILEGGHVDIALERLKNDDVLERFRTLRHLPIRTILLRSGERVEGRILKMTETHVDMLFPTARVVFHRDEIEKIEK